MPFSDLSALSHSEKLSARIREEIAACGGVISFAHFMQVALYAPGLGYYSAGSHKFGKEGDFVTAPELSPLFAQAIANQVRSIFAEQVEKNFLEIGAGSGCFAAALLTEVRPRHYYILEVSAELRERQQKLLQATHADFFEKIIWLDALPENFSGVIFANEVMDAMPVNLFFLDEENAVKEYGIAWEENKLVWRRENASTALTEKVMQLQQECGFAAPYQSEINLLLSAWIASLAACLKQGVILLIDYGYGRGEYYHPDRKQGTLMCFYQHHQHSNPLQHIGLQDITAHVDFTLVAESAIHANLALAGFTTQAAFLLSCGLMELANQKTLSPAETYQQNQAIKRLILPGQMGEVVKVMALAKDFSLPLIGFSLQDRKRDL